MKKFFNAAAPAGMILLLTLIPAGCSQSNGGDPFVPVTNITGVPGTATAGIPLALTGTVEPGNATNTAITWAVRDPGSAGAAIGGNILTTTAGGTVVVTATVVNGAASGNYTRDFTIIVSSGGDMAVTDFSLDTKVTAPVRGIESDTGPIDAAQYTGTIAWQTSGGAPHTGAFAPSTVYRAVVTLTAKPGYTFAGLGSNSFTYNGAASVANAANSGTVTITFPATAAPGEDTVVTFRFLNGYVTAPVKGAIPDTTAINAAQYTGIIAWQTEDGAAHTGAFAPSTVYRAVLTLTAKPGYTFTGLGSNSFTYTGAASVSNAANSGTVTITFPATAGEDGSEPTVVSALSLDGYITAPVKGAAPGATAIDTAQYTGIIAWQTGGGAPHTGAFVADTVYKAALTLTAKPGYTFTGVTANSFTHSGATEVANAANSGRVTITFPVTEGEDGPEPEAEIVSALSLDGYVTAPVRDAVPGATAIDTAQYTGTIAWQTGGGAPHTGAFAAHTVYRAVVTLIAKPGYTFTGLGDYSFTCAGAESVVNAANSGTVTITFPLTEAAVVSAFSLDSYVIVPVRGAASDATMIYTAQYTGTFAWQTEGGAAHTGAFAANTVYKAVVILTANPGYTFTGVEVNSFTYSGATSVTNAANSGTVIITFPATEAAVVSAFSLDGYVTAPVRDATPDTTAIDTAQYTGTIAWQTDGGAAHTGVFAPSTVYRAVLTLTAKPGYTFTGVGANRFTCSGVTSVTNAANNGTVTITFPATAVVGNADFQFSFTGPNGSNDISVYGGFKLSKSDGSYSSITISVENTWNYNAFRWLVDGGVLAGETGNSVTLYASNYAIGAHWLTIIVEQYGIPYSREFSFAVVN